MRGIQGLIHFGDGEEVQGAIPDYFLMIMNYVKLALASLPSVATIAPAKDNQLLYHYAAIGAADMALSYVSKGNFPKAWVTMQNASRYRVLAGETPDSGERTALQKLCSRITPVVN